MNGSSSELRQSEAHTGEARSTDGAASHQVVCHADDRRRIKATAELSQNRRLGLQPDSHGFAKQRAKLLFVAALVSVADRIADRHLPEPANARRLQPTRIPRDQEARSRCL